MNRKAFWFFGLVFVFLAMPVLSLVYAQNQTGGQPQTPGQIAKFDDDLNLVDSVITETADGNIGIGTTTPTAKLHVAGGHVQLENSTPTSGNLLKGGALFLHNFGMNNTFLGQNAGNLTMTGFENTASGSGALFSNTTGYRNTASGYQVLQNNTTGFQNTASGFFALQSNTTGDGNTASGFAALQRNTTGGMNTASGFAALGSNTTGDSNTASGLALANNTTGSLNTASGRSALFNNTTGERNTASGVDALRSNTTGDENTAIGSRADVSAGNLTNATAIGARAIVDASNKIRLGNADVTVIEGEVPFTFISDATKKENFQPVDGEEVLRKIGGLSLTSWNYIGHDPKKFRHYGPVAQEFFAAFGHDGVGTIGTPTTINSGDMAGILMIAVQALEQRTAALAAENAELRARLEAWERQSGR